MQVLHKCRHTRKRFCCNGYHLHHPSPALGHTEITLFLRADPSPLTHGPITFNLWAEPGLVPGCSGRRLCGLGLAGLHGAVRVRACLSLCVCVQGMPLLPTCVCVILLSRALSVCNAPLTCGGVCVSVSGVPLSPAHLPGSALLPPAAGGSVHWLIR